MSAETLRRAAVAMRRNAERMPPGPYGMSSAWTTPTTMLSRVTRRGGVLAEVRGRDNDSQGVYTVNYFASWHPAVALAVADWLEVTERDVGTSSLAYHAALAVARAYLGEERP